MRSDMAKVIVDLPRPGKRDRRMVVKGYKKTVSKQIANDETKTRERITDRCGGRRRPPNDRLGPLRRFLRSRVGRPWNKVHEEISQHISHNKLMDQHLMDHISFEVALHVIIKGSGKHKKIYPKVQRSWGGIAEIYQRFYVCPKGFLRANDNGRRRFRHTPTTPDSIPHPSKENHRLIKIDDVWYELEMGTLPEPTKFTHIPQRPLVYGSKHMIGPTKHPDYDYKFDVIRSERVHRGMSELTKLYGNSSLYAKSKRQLGAREIKKLKLN